MPVYWHNDGLQVYNNEKGAEWAKYHCLKNCSKIIVSNGKIEEGFSNGARVYHTMCIGKAISDGALKIKAGNHTAWCREGRLSAPQHTDVIDAAIKFGAIGDCAKVLVEDGKVIRKAGDKDWMLSALGQLH